MKPYNFFLISVILLLLSGCAMPHRSCSVPSVEATVISGTQLLSDMRHLADDRLAGRKTGTIGNQLAQDFIIERFRQIKLTKYNPEFRHPFKFGSQLNRNGTNLIGWIPGKVHPERYIVVTAHYDHLGTFGSKIYNGADDNASGVATMLQLAERFAEKSPQHSIMFVATDAEEAGLYGAHAFVNNPPIPLENIILNINLDMIAQGGKSKRLYVAGTRKNSHLRPMIDQAASEARVCLKVGHEGKTRSRKGFQTRINWRNASDHAPFNARDIPYLYFGVDPHRHYHQPTDTAHSINPIFFIGAAETIVNAVRHIDDKLPSSSPSAINGSGSR